MAHRQPFTFVMPPILGEIYAGPKDSSTFSEYPSPQQPLSIGKALLVFTEADGVSFRPTATRKELNRLVDNPNARVSPNLTEAAARLFPRKSGYESVQSLSELYTEVLDKVNNPLEDFRDQVKPEGSIRTLLDWQLDELHPNLDYLGHRLQECLRHSDASRGAAMLWDEIRTLQSVISIRRIVQAGIGDRYRAYLADYLGPGGEARPRKRSPADVTAHKKTMEEFTSLMIQTYAGNEIGMTALRLLADRFVNMQVADGTAKDKLSRYLDQGISPSRIVSPDLFALVKEALDSEQKSPGKRRTAERNAQVVRLAVVAALSGGIGAVAGNQDLQAMLSYAGGYIQDLYGGLTTSKSTIAAPSLPNVEDFGIKAAAEIGPLLEEMEKNSFSARIANAPIIPKAAATYENLVSRYGTTIYPSLDAMPDELKAYFIDNATAVADKVGVRPEHILAFLITETKGKGFRLVEPEVSEAGAIGVGQITPGFWNGWYGDNFITHETNQRVILESRGYGVAWSHIDQVLAYQRGEIPSSALEGVVADPHSFINTLASIALFLKDNHMYADGQLSPEEVMDAAAIYNSGQPLSVSENYKQSEWSNWTVRTYAEFYAQAATALKGYFVKSEVVSSEPVAVPVSTQSVLGYTASPFETTLEKGDRHIIEQLQLTHDNLFAAPVPEWALQQLWLDTRFVGILEDARATGDLTLEAQQEVINILSEIYVLDGIAAVQSGGERRFPYALSSHMVTAQALASSVFGRPLLQNELDQLMNIVPVVNDQWDIEQARQFLASDLGRTSTYAIFKDVYDQFMANSHTDVGTRLDRHELATAISETMANYGNQVDWANMQKGTREGIINGFASLLNDRTIAPTIEHSGNIGVQSNFARQQNYSGQYFPLSLLSPDVSIEQKLEYFAGRQVTTMPHAPMSNFTINKWRQFGASVDYQVGGMHTGVDMVADQVLEQGDYKEPLLFAVDDGVVVYVGDLYLDGPNEGRGKYSVVVLHGQLNGELIYSLYSHGSESFVVPGDLVERGMPIGRMGNNGYSFGSHLHFELHVGGRFTGNWREPFVQGRFIDPVGIVAGVRRVE